MSSWFEDFLTKLAMKKTALDKLPPEDMSGAMENDPTAKPDDGGAEGQDSMMDPSMMQDLGQDLFGGGAPPDVQMMEEETPVAFNNKYVIKTPDGMGFVVEFEPHLLTEEDMGKSGPGGQGGGVMQQMQDKTYNPNSDPEALLQWLQTEKNYAHKSKGTVDPLSQQEEGIGPDGSVPVHQLNKTQSLLPKKNLKKKAEPAVMPGADRSNPYAPCCYCANYIASTNECKQGLDVEKVQAAKSCSWLNSSFSPFKEQEPQMDGHNDQETYKSDISQMSGGAGPESDRMSGAH